MTGWTELVEEALRELGGQEVYVPGAKLHAEVTNLGLKERRESFKEYLDTEGISFRQFLQKMAQVRVDVQPGTDMLVGLPGADMPKAAEHRARRRARGGPMLRDDIYAAFTRVSQRPYVYVPSTDEFTTDPGDAPDQVSVPPVSLEALLGDRQQFAKSLEDDAERELMSAVKYSANPLAAFHWKAGELALLPRWHAFNYELIQNRVKAWADENGLMASESWFTPRRPGDLIDDPQRILAEVARHMRDEEIRELAIPFRAVEEMYRALSRKQGS